MFTIASSKAQLVLEKLNTDPQGRDALVTYAVVSLLATYGADVGLDNPVDDVVSQIDAQFPKVGADKAFVTQRVEDYLAPMRESIARGV